MQVLEDLFSSSPKQWEPEYCWQDREIRFDVHPKELKCRPSEDIIETMDPVEDTKVAWRIVFLLACGALGLESHSFSQVLLPDLIRLSFP